MTRDDITLWLSRIIYDPAIPIRQRLSAARQISNLNGWDDPKNQKPDGKSVMAEMLKATNWSSSRLANEGESILH